MCLRPHTRADEPPHSALPRWWLHSILCRCVMQLLNLIRALCCRCYRHWPSAAHKCHRNIFLKKTNNAHTHINLHAHWYVCVCVCFKKCRLPFLTSTIACLTYSVAPCGYTNIVVKILSVDMHKNFPVGKLTKFIF